jgi:glycosyltransferase involved in cell wall biosynthesis
VLDIDDVPSTCERATLRVESGLRARLLTIRRLASWRRREKLLSDRFTVLTVCSDEDRSYLRGIGLKAPLHVIPNAFAKPSFEPIRCPATPPRIGFIGLLEHFPNRDGIEWFTSQCWPRIKRELPGVRLRLVGLGSDGPLKLHATDVDGLGWLADPAEEIGTWSAMIVPIRLGGGTRVKIVEGFGRKCPIVSTSLGAHGYKARDGYDMYIADSAEAFSDACIKTICDPIGAAQVAERAWGEFLQSWTWDAICPMVWSAAEDCLRLTSRN